MDYYFVLNQFVIQKMMMLKMKLLKNHSFLLILFTTINYIFILDKIKNIHKKSKKNN